MSEQKDQTEATCGGSALTAELDAFGVAVSELVGMYVLTGVASDMFLEKAKVFWDKATKLERDACAALCDNVFAKRDLHGMTQAADAAEFCACEIRKRSNV